MESVDYVTSDTVWEFTDLPSRLLVIGGGPIGCELAQAFARLGSQVVVVTRAGGLMPREDADVAEHVQQVFRNEGIEVLTNHRTRCFHSRQGEQTLELLNPAGETVQIAFDRVLLAVGREARSGQFSDIELPITESGTLQVNEHLQTPYPNILAAGDIVGPYQFTHVASHQAWYATVNALFGRLRKFKVDYRVIPWVTFTDPEVARVGINESEAVDQGLPVDVTRYELDDLDRAITDGKAQGFIKVITRQGSDRVLGVTIVGHHAGELIAEWVLAMKYGLGLNKILGTIHVYPTFSETNKFAAGNWKKANAPERLLGYVQRFHQFMRG